MENPEFKPAALIAHRHAQSVLASCPPRSLIVRGKWRQFSPLVEDTIVDSGAGVRLLGHYSPPLSKTPGERSEALGLAVLIHGWEGSADSTYMLSATMELLASGYAVFRLNLRDHGQSHHLNEDLFHSCRIAEVVGAVQWISRHYQPSRLSLAGFSLGGNFALRVAAAAATHQLPLDRVVAACPVLDPAQTMVALDSGWALYRHYFILRWRNSLLKKMNCFPGRYQFEKLQRFTSLEAMTDYFVRYYTEYDDLHAYLSGYALTGDRLANLSVSSSMLLADDDPIIPIQSLNEICDSPALRVVRTRTGGHCGYLAGFRSQTWLDKYLVEQLSPDIQA